MQIRFILIFLAILPFGLAAQIDEDFDVQSVEELSFWSGDLDDFIINEDGQLQLSAAEKGSSSILAPVSLSESTEWQFYFNLDFAPSNSNQLRVYLFADDSSLDESDGYYLEVGETGANDKLKFYRQENGDKTLLGEGSMAALGTAPSVAKIKVVKISDGDWRFFAAYNNDPFVQLEFELSEKKIALTNGFFGLTCKYSETRKDKFLFDDIYVGDIKIDTEAPILISAKFDSPTQIRLQFDELLLPDVALDPSIYIIDNGLGNPVNVTLGEFDNEILLTINPAADGIIYTLSIEGLEDLSGNRISTDRTLVLSSQPTKGDLVINEILFDPNPGTEDFVELYNISDKFLSLEGLILQNLDNQRAVQLSTDIVLAPLQYLAITPDAEALDKDYMLLIPENILEHSLPSWSNNAGNATLTLEGLTEPLDSYDYTEDKHSVWIDDAEGVSLERIDPAIDTNLDSNWQSASEQSGFATPGYRNSNFTELGIDETEFVLSKKTFSPDGDGFDDVLEINYRVITSGFVLNMRVFDDRGYLIRTLTNNEILGREGTVIWDGTTDEGGLGKMGIHIIWLEYFDEQGTIGHKKLSCVLAKQLN